MNKKDIETLAVNAVRDSIAVCDYMEPYLNDNDKTPSWDGDIYIYTTPDRKKENLRGLIKSQIKGKEQSNLSINIISYPVSVIDLKNFLRTGSTIYFVVYISSNKVDRQIYYNDLNPVKLKHYIKIAKGKTIKIPFKRFPNDAVGKTDICVNLYDDGVKQMSHQEHIISFEELQNRSIAKIDLSYTSYAKEAPDIVQLMLDNSASIYVQLENSDISYPLDTTDLELQIEFKRDLTVRVGETTFYSNIIAKRTANKLTIRVGDSLDIVYNKDTRLITFNYRLTQSLRNAVVDLAFMNAVMDAKEFWINNTLYGIPEGIVSNYNREWGSSTLASMVDYVKALEILKVEKDIEWETLSAQEHRDFKTIVKALVRNELVYDLNDNLPPVCIMEIQGIKLLLGVERSEASSNAWKVYNVFEHPAINNLQYRKTENDPILPTSMYTLLKADDYNSIDNINYETLPETYKCLKDSNPMIVDIVNRDLLIMLLAYDKHPNERLLKAVEDLAKWILNDASFPELPYESRYLNLMQIYKRTRNLTNEEKEQIYDIYDNAKISDIKVAAALLLEDYVGAKRNFAKMALGEQDLFKTLPIYNLWRE